VKLPWHDADRSSHARHKGMRRKADAFILLH
jgi:hypothetical protein